MLVTVLYWHVIVQVCTCTCVCFHVARLCGWALVIFLCWRREPDITNIFEHLEMMNAKAHRNAKSNDCLMWVDTMWCVFFFCFIFYRHRFCLFGSVVLAHYSFYYSRLTQAKVESLLRVSHWQIDGTCYTSSQWLYVCKFKKHSLTLTASTLFYCCWMKYKSIEYVYLGSSLWNYIQEIPENLDTDSFKRINRMVW